ncbi:Clan CA, family C19, ubiquitin hydrolase-like cysteine peptidase [Tritrichomonas foetus]|uniref:Clan CA, family C19, ubiquitin hydrolase-like cysteine peptidase n=1 Tax=Tritrichomonas foetus TaxID=1144522 RepID=A0A1J4KHJ3_9EUKA|nr:Clan CA, family C19, ubiquitin hydrolase-like cysteine peptidase [Tritrichomonas foetus]|eukprot:OHT10667.1 Clan CA, family C19, ubiquitin hydrolase-like cysteine peptidase [Tritrichomonas foetus]
MSIHERLGNFPGDHTIIQLANSNGTCYINSILQSMFNLPSIIQYLEEVEEKLVQLNLKEENEQSLFGLFLKIYIDSMRAPQNEVYYEPNYFLDELFKTLTMFQRGNQADAFDFYHQMLISFDQSNTFMNEIIGKNEIPLFSSFFRIVIDENYYRRHEFINYCAITVLPNNEGLEKAIEKWMTPARGISRTFYELPQIFCLRINVFTVENGELKKNFTKTPIPLGFSLRERDSEVNYTFISSVIHNGDHFNDGHFISIFYTCDRIIVGDDANFWGLNDEQLSNFLEFNEVPGSEKSSAIYILFYQRI